jgi:hypothetical protein
LNNGHTSYTLNAAANMVTIEQIGLLPRIELTELPEQSNSGSIGLNAEKTLRKSLPHAPVPELYAIT